MATSNDCNAVSKNHTDPREVFSELRDFMCEPCEKDGAKVEAGGYCVDCSEYLCGQCYNYHQLLKAFQNHILLDQDKMPLDPERVKIKDSCIEKCDTHQDKVIEYFCRSCDSLGCTACITLDHRKCEKVSLIPDLARKLESDKEFKQLISDIGGLSVELSYCKNTIDSNMHIIDEMNKRAVVKLKEERDEVKKVFDNLEKTLAMQIEDKKRVGETALHAASELERSMNSDLQKMQSNIANKMKNGQKCEMYIAMKTAKTRLQGIQNDLEKLKKESRFERFVFRPSEVVEEMRKSMKEIGSLDVLNPGKKVKLIFNSEIKINTSRDKQTPLILGLCELSEDLLIASDFKNCSLKVVDTMKKTVVSEVEVETAPFDITVTKAGELAATLPDVAMIQFLIVSKCGILSKSHQIEVGGACCGIVCSKGNLIISYVDGKVQILNINGNVIKNITICSDRKDVFCRPGVLGLSSDHKTLYVSDRVHNSVTNLTLDGKVKAIYKNKDMGLPHGIAMDRDGNVYVCNLGVGNIHQLSEDCSKIQILNIPAGSMMFSNSTNKLYVALDKILVGRMTDVVY